MNAQIREDSRPLREFYPEAELRHQVHYAFAHRFVPFYVQQNPYAFFSYLYNAELPGGVSEPNRFIHSRWSAIFEPRLAAVLPQAAPPGGEMILRRVTDLSMSIVKLSGRPCALVQMPTPEQPVEAYYVCVVLMAPASPVAAWPRDVPARVFTSEAAFSDQPDRKTAIVCEWSREGGHRNFGLSIPVDRESFLRAVSTVLQASGGGAAGEAPGAGLAGGAGSAGGDVAGGDVRGGGEGPARAKKPWWKVW